jgi:hypothetical protein
MENQNFDIFGKSSIDVNSYKQPEKRESVIYAPKAKDTSDGTYNSKVRFLYNPTDPENGSIIRKIVYYLKDAQDKGHYFDSPQSVGNWDACPIGKLWQQLNKSESALDRQNAKQLNRREVFYSLVYIVNDQVNPGLNGKIKILKYGKKLKAKLDRYLNPPNNGAKVDIFNFYTGYNFDMNITRQGNFNDYDAANFEITPSQIPIEGLTGEETDRDILQKLMADAPDLNSYRYEAWDDQQRATLESILNQYRSPGAAVSKIVQDNGSTATPEATVVVEAKPATESAPAATESAPTATAEAPKEDENLDEFLDGLGI